MNSVERFSSRVEDYVKYRPGYPAEIVHLLTSRYGLTRDSIIADIGSGTGKLSELFLRNGNRVFGVEPNSEMRKAGERLMAGFPQFTSIDGKAESTLLPNASCDFVAAGQAFHWFDQSKARLEFSRILRPEGWVAIIWNERRLDANAFLRDYEALLLKFGTDYEVVRHENTAAVIGSFFLGEYTRERFDNFQESDFDGLRGRVSSSSYIPQPGTEAYLEMLKALEGLFARYADGGRVVVEYDTSVYVGRLRP
jgi:SAM-dependent methyltransferase